MKLKMSRGLSSFARERLVILNRNTFSSSRVFNNFLTAHPSRDCGNYKTNKCSAWRETRIEGCLMCDWREKSREGSICWISFSNDRWETFWWRNYGNQLRASRFSNKHSRSWFEASKPSVNLRDPLKSQSSLLFVYLKTRGCFIYGPTSSLCTRKDPKHSLSSSPLCNRCAEAPKESLENFSLFLLFRRVRVRTKCVKRNRQSVGTITRTVCVDNWSVREKSQNHFFTRTQTSDSRSERLGWKPVRLIEK